MGLDDRLKKDLARLAPTDPSGAYERVVEKRVRRRLLRKAQAVVLAVVVVSGTAFGFYGLSRVFGTGPTVLGGGPGNGLIGYSVSDDGRSSEIDLIEPAGGQPRRIAKVDGLVTGLDWAPDGRLLAYDLHPASGGGIFVMDADGNDPRRLTEPGALAFGPSWSPDGTRIAFTVDYESPAQDAICVMNADGSDPHVVTHAADLGTVDWSPDGRRLVFTGPGPEGDYQGWDIYVVNVDGTGLRNITNHPSVDLEPRWSPAGSEILFRSRRDTSPGAPSGRDNGPDEIYVMSPDGSDLRRLTYDDATDQGAIWSPDGTRIAFTSFSETGREPGVYIMDADGTDVRLIMTTSAPALAWQPVPSDATTVTPSVAPTATITPEPTPTETTSPSTELAGVGRVCDLTSVSADFTGTGRLGTAYVFEPEPEGGCDGPNENFQYLGVAPTGERVELVSSELRECTDLRGCRIFAAPDIDGDGIAEIAVLAFHEYSADFISLYRVLECAPSADCAGPERFEIAEPGDAAEGYPPGPAVFRWGGPPDDVAGIRCDFSPEGNAELVAWFTAAGEDHLEIHGQELVVTTTGEPWDVSQPPSLNEMCGAPVAGIGG